MWDELARRTFLSRGYVKRLAYRLFFGAAVDPWMDHIVRKEIDSITESRKR